MKTIYMILIVLLVAGCEKFYSNMDVSEISKYKGEFKVENNELIVEFDNLPGFMVYEIDHRFIDDKLYLSAHRISSGGGKKTYKIDLTNYPSFDIYTQLYWLNPDSKTEKIPNKYIK